MTINLYISVDQNNAIGNSDGSLPWKLSHNENRFRKFTDGKAVLVGLNTFTNSNSDSYLVEQATIVLSKSMPRNPRRRDIVVADCLDWLRAHQECLGCVPPDLWIGGGKEVFMQVLEEGLADVLYLTQVHTDSGAKVRMPIELYNWKLFVLQQQALGYSWVLVKQEFPSPKDGEPTTTYSTFKKMKT